MCRQINDISNEMIVKLCDRDFNYFSLALDESTNILDIAQIVVFVHGVNESFKVIEENST